jgi:hypothetical protein
MKKIEKKKQIYFIGLYKKESSFGIYAAKLREYLEKNKSYELHNLMEVIL